MSLHSGLLSASRELDARNSKTATIVFIRILFPSHLLCVLPYRLYPRFIKAGTPTSTMSQAALGRGDRYIGCFGEFFGVGEILETCESGSWPGLQFLRCAVPPAASIRGHGRFVVESGVSG